MGVCRNCGASSPLISGSIGVCLACLRGGFAGLDDHLRDVHRKSRERFSLPGMPPRDQNGITCTLCANACRIGEGRVGYCGIRSNKGGKITGGTAKANVEWYHDPLPTNCVADWVCPGGTGAGYPQFAYSPGPEYGFTNLAVFYNGCSFNCLYCQNWHFRERVYKGASVPADELAGFVDEDTSCICYFGGDPTPHLVHSINTAKKAMQRGNRIVRICWETNGSMNPKLLSKAIDIALESGGCIKFDLKAWTVNLHVALCGASNERTLDNFRMAARHFGKRPEVPLLLASTLLVPGYIDAEEVFRIASFISSCSPDIPYSLLGFYPQFMMSDLPTTTKTQAGKCIEAAREAGLRRVRIGNMHLLA
jgi:pyruvate formate lyase activating enzyme